MQNLVGALKAGRPTDQPAQSVPAGQSVKALKFNAAIRRAMRGVQVVARANTVAISAERKRLVEARLTQDDGASAPPERDNHEQYPLTKPISCSLLSAPIRRVLQMQQGACTGGNRPQNGAYVINTDGTEEADLQKLYIACAVLADNFGFPTVRSSLRSHWQQTSVSCRAVLEASCFGSSTTQSAAQASSVLEPDFPIPDAVQQMATKDLRRALKRLRVDSMKPSERLYTCNGPLSAVSVVLRGTAAEFEPLGNDHFHHMLQCHQTMTSLLPRVDMAGCAVDAGADPQTGAWLWTVRLWLPTLGVKV